MKPGYKTTEFWITLLVTILTAIMPLFTNMNVPADTTIIAADGQPSAVNSPATAELASFAPVVAGAGYAISRGLAKRG